MLTKFSFQPNLKFRPNAENSLKALFATINPKDLMLLKHGHTPISSRPSQQFLKNDEEDTLRIYIYVISKRNIQFNLYFIF